MKIQKLIRLFCITALCFNANAQTTIEPPTLAIRNSGIYDVKSGDYTLTSATEEFVWLPQGKSAIVNVGDGTGTVSATVQDYKWMIAVAGNTNNIYEPTKTSSLIWNGNLVANINYTAKPQKDGGISAIDVNDDMSSIVFNGDITLKGTITCDYKDYFYTQLYKAQNYAKTDFNGNIDFSLKTITTNSVAASAVVVEIGNSVTVNLGKSSTDKVWIHDIYTEGAGAVESYGIYGKNGGVEKNYVINVKGQAVIENISAIKTSDGNVSSPYSYASGAEIMDGGTLNFESDLTIKNIQAEEAYALSATFGGKINVNAAETNTVQIEGNLGTLDLNNDGSKIDIKLTDSKSYFKGAIVEIIADNGGTVNLALKNGATWSVTKDSTVQNLSVANQSKLTFYAPVDKTSNKALGTITLKGGSNIIEKTTLISVLLNDSYKTLTCDNEFLLIDSSASTSANVELADVSGEFLYESDNSTADNWTLEFRDGEGLFALFDYIDPTAMLATPPQYVSRAIRQNFDLLHSIHLDTLHRTSATRDILRLLTPEELETMYGATMITVRSISRIATYNGNASVDGSHDYIYGGLVNLEYVANKQFFAGFGIGGFEEKTSGKGISGTAETQTFAMNAYADYEFYNNFDWYIGATFAHGIIDGERYIDANRAYADWDTTSFGVFTGIRYTFNPIENDKSFAIRPVVGINTSWVFSPNFNEKSNGATMSKIQSETYESIKSLIGLELVKSFAFGLRASVHMYYTHEFGDNSYDFNAQMLGNVGFISTRYNHYKLNRDSGIFGFGLEQNIDKNWSVYGGYSAEVSDNLYNNVNLGFRYRF